MIVFLLFILIWTVKNVNYETKQTNKIKTFLLTSKYKKKINTSLTKQNKNEKYKKIT
jgi:hypothetical protein